MAKIAADYPDIEVRHRRRRRSTLPNVTSSCSPRSRAPTWSGAAAAQATKAEQRRLRRRRRDRPDQEVPGRLRRRRRRRSTRTSRSRSSTSRPEGDFTGFNDPAKGETIATGLYDDGADVVYHAAGRLRDRRLQGGGRGGSPRHRRRHRPVLPGPGETEQKCMLSSMTQAGRRGRLRRRSRSYVDGSTARPACRSFDLKNGGIDYATAGGQIPDTGPARRPEAADHRRRDQGAHHTLIRCRLETRDRSASPGSEPFRRSP